MKVTIKKLQTHIRTILTQMVKIISTDTEKDKEYGLATSIAAGLGSGFLKILAGNL